MGGGQQKFRRWRSFATVLFVAATVALAAHSVPSEILLRSIIFLDMWIVVGLFLIFLIMRVWQAAALKISLAMVERQVSLLAAIGLIAIKGLFNQGVSGAGLVAQGVRAKHRFAIRYRDFGIVTFIQALTLTGTLGALLFLALMGLVFTGSGLNALIILVAMIAMGLPIAASLLWNAIPHDRISDRVSGWPDSEASKRLRSALFQTRGIWIVASQAAFFGFRFCKFAAIALLIQPDVSLTHLLVIVLIADLATVVPITPGGIGVRELVIATGGAMLGDLEVALSAAIIDRVTGIAFSLIHGLFVVALHQWEGHDGREYPGRN